jgi:hypothetical protein
MVNSTVSEYSPWNSFLAGLSARTGMSEKRLLSIGLVASAVAAFLGGEGFDSIGWDSAGLMLRVTTAVAAAASVVVLLPSIGRRIVISLVILFHFGGILTAVTSVDPAPWLTHQLWTYIYRPYLQFFYLNNAYHFYSPEPGPAHLLWFCVEYEQEPAGTRNLRWVFEPDLDTAGRPYDAEGRRIWSGTEYTRRLSLSENSAHRGPLPFNWIELLKLRDEAGKLQEMPLLFPFEMAYQDQYREPDGASKRWVQAYARHVARSYKHELKPQLKSTGVKVYLVLHRFLGPGELTAGAKPDDINTYLPFYFGEFDPNGNMKKTCQEIQVLDSGEFRETYRDPFLYWLIRIEDVRRHAEGQEGLVPWANFNKGEDQ